MDGVPARLSVVTLGTANLPALRRFYGRLGWEEVPGSSDEWAAFLLGGVVLALYPEQELAGEALSGGEETSTGSWRGVTLAVNVESRQVDAAYGAVLKAGGRAVAEPQERSWVAGPPTSPIPKETGGSSPTHPVPSDVNARSDCTATP